MLTKVVITPIQYEILIFTANVDITVMWFSKVCWSNQMLCLPCHRIKTRHFWKSNTVPTCWKGCWNHQIKAKKYKLVSSEIVELHGSLKLFSKRIKTKETNAPFLKPLASVLAEAENTKLTGHKVNVSLISGTLPAAQTVRPVTAVQRKHRPLSAPSRVWLDPTGAESGPPCYFSSSELVLPPPASYSSRLLSKRREGRDPWRFIMRRTEECRQILQRRCGRRGLYMFHFERYVAELGAIMAEWKLILWKRPSAVSVLRVWHLVLTLTQITLFLRQLREQCSMQNNR